MTRATLFAAAADLVCAQLRQLLPVDPPLDIAAHSGRFDMAELKRTVARGVAVRVTTVGLGPRPSVAGAATELELRMAAFVIVSGDAPKKQDFVALTLVQSIVSLVQDYGFGDVDLGPARLGAVENLYDGAGRTASALWGIAWSHPVQLSRRADDARQLLQILGSFDPEAPAEDFEIIAEEASA
ncbi:MAG: hypothetical protein AAF192_11530 [Pseudomonadota bacterium]